jgi:hypothetical protein
MNRPHFRDYITEIDNAFGTYRAKVSEIEEELATAKKAADDAKNNRNFTPERKEVAKQDYQAAKKKANADLEAAQEAARQAMSSARKELAADVSEYTKINPDRVNATTLALLQSGAMTADDLVALTEKHKNNTTMLKLIGNEADKMKDTSPLAHALALKINDYVSADSRLSVYDTAVAVVSRGLAPAHLANAIGELWDGNEGRSKYEAQMTALEAFKSAE